MAYAYQSECILKTAELKMYSYFEKKVKQRTKMNFTCLLKEGTNQTKTQSLVFPFKGRGD